MFPFISIDTSTTTTTNQLDVPCEYAYDVITNKFLTQDGKMYFVYGKEALRIWVYKALKTPRGRFYAYSWQFGHDLESLIGSGLTRAAMKSEAERMVRECVTKNPHISDIQNFAVIFEDIFMHIYFEAITDQGNVPVDLNL